MAGRLILSIDGMGGDNAPRIVIEGIDIQARRRGNVHYLVHGDPARLQPLLDAHPHAKAVCEIRAAESVIGMDAKPSQALRQGRGSSLWNAIQSVENKEAAAIVSAGSTGALMAISMFRLRTMEGVHRPALVARWPTQKGMAAVLDVGANVQADAEQLVEFAIMGEAFQRALTGKERPTVGLLNVGSEDQKGHEEIRAAAKLLREAGLDIAVHGFVEGDDIPKGTADVVVTDGFTGNIALKTAEGMARTIGGYVKDAMMDGVLAKIGALFAYGALARFKNKVNPGNSNGAMFLGLNGLVVKSHGSADGPSYAAALEVAALMANSHYQEEIARNLARFAAAERAMAAELAARDAS